METNNSLHPSNNNDITIEYYSEERGLYIQWRTGGSIFREAETNECKGSSRRKRRLQMRFRGVLNYPLWRTAKELFEAIQENPKFGGWRAESLVRPFEMRVIGCHESTDFLSSADKTRIVIHVDLLSFHIEHIE
mmetsp:Transcript_24835/g.34591  ORF Transcript_24835/g.34591 Transcript_24835/m.34591 type:complete len:134 (-) Transcript_24835:45-446(-)